MPPIACGAVCDGTVAAAAKVVDNRLSWRELMTARRPTCQRVYERLGALALFVPRRSGSPGQRQQCAYPVNILAAAVRAGAGQWRRPLTWQVLIWIVDVAVMGSTPPTALIGPRWTAVALQAPHGAEPLAGP